jgi:hypothetical protein
MNRTHRVAIRLTDDELMILKRIATNTNQTMSETIRSAIITLSLEMYDSEVIKLKQRNEELLKTISNIKQVAEEST